MKKMEVTTITSIATVLLAALSVTMHTGVLYNILTAPVILQSHIDLISSGCGYDSDSQVMCTHELCMKGPNLLERGPRRQTILGSTTPSWIYIEHKVGFLGLKTKYTNITGVKSIQCLLEHLD